MEMHRFKALPPFLPPFLPSLCPELSGAAAERRRPAYKKKEEEEGGGRVENSALVRSFVLSLTLHLIKEGRSHPRRRLRDTATRTCANSMPRPVHERVERERGRREDGERETLQQFF